jgi:hypothetical protein
MNFASGLYKLQIIETLRQTQKFSCLAVNIDNEKKTRSASMSATGKHKFLTKLKESFAHNFTTQLDVQATGEILLKCAYI